MTETKKQGQQRQGDSIWNMRTFRWFLLGFAAVGLLFIVSALAKPHKTGVVVSVGRISTQTGHTGTGIHRHTYKNYAADVKVRVKDTSERTTVYYRVKNRESIPAVGDEIRFGNSLAVGNTPYPQMWAVWTGVVFLGLDVVMLLGYCIAKRSRASRQENPWASV